MNFEDIKNMLFFPSISVFEYYLLNVLILMIIYIFLAYLVNLIIMQTPIYINKQEFIDSDYRTKLGWSVGFIFSIFLITVNIIYIWLKRNYGTPVDILAHWTVILINFIIWLIIFLSKRSYLKAARKPVS